MAGSVLELVAERWKLAPIGAHSRPNVQVPATLSRGALLTTFAPVRLLTKLLAVSSGPMQVRFSGAVLAVDISGYTQLTAQLAAQPSGVEKLSALVDASIGHFIALVDNLGGEVVTFTGDGLVAYWDSDDTMALAARRAADCARRVEESARSSILEAAGIRVHSGLGAGELWGARLGQRWPRVLLGGPAHDSALMACQRAHPGEVLVDRDLGGLLSRPDTARPGQAAARFSVREDGEVRLETVETAPPPRQLPSSEIDSNIVARMIPRVLSERLGMVEDDWLAELRRVATVFLRIEGLDRLPQDLWQRHQIVVLALEEALVELSASAGELALDRGSLVFHLAFGTPHNAPSDLVARAAMAAHTATGRLQSLGLKVSGGVAAGEVYVGPVGAKARRHYAILGPPMNLAARLMAAADNEIFLERSVADAVDELHSEPRDPLQLKGLTEPVEVSVLRQRQASALRRGRILGREAERARLLALLEDLAKGQGNVVLIEGDAGLGKSKLVEALVDDASARGLAPVVAVADELQTTAFAVVRRMLLALLGWTPAEGSEALKQRIEALLEPTERLLLPLLRAVLPLDASETEVTRQLAGESRAEATLALVAGLFADLVEPPRVLVVENVHWLDGASWRLFGLLARIPGVLMVLTTRPVFDRAQLEPWPEPIRLELQPLPNQLLAELLADRLGAPPSEALVSLIARQSDGNPLFAGEYALLLLSTDALVRRRGRVELRAGSEARVHAAPATLASTITGRIDALDPKAQLVLKTASVLGDRFDLQLLQVILPSELGPIEPILAELELQRLLLKVNGQLAFGHAVVREVAYGLMLHEQRRALHRSAAEALEISSTDPGRHALLAYHWAGAEDALRTVANADLAASLALGAGAHREAVQLLLQCLRYADAAGASDPLLRIRWNRQLSEAYHGLGELEARGRHARTVLELANRVVQAPKGWAGAVWGLLGHALVPRRPVLAAPEDAELRQELAKAYRQVAVVAYFAADAKTLVIGTLAAIEQAERGGPSPDLSGAYAELAGSFGVAGLPRLAERYLALARSIGVLIEDRAALAYVHMVGALYYVGRGAWAATEANVNDCQKHCDALGDALNWGNAQVIRFWLDFYRGNYSQAAESARALTERARSVGNRQHEAWGLSAWAQCDIRVGNNLLGIEKLENALELFGHNADLQWRTQAVGELAACRLRAGDPDKARLLASEILEVLRGVKRPTGHAMLEGLSALAEVVFAADSARVPEIMEHLDHYRQVFVIGGPRYHFWRARMLEAQGALGRAARQRRRGRRAAEKLGMVADAGRF